MKKLILSLFAVVCFCCTAMANMDTNGVVIRGEGPWAQSQYKRALSLEAAGKIDNVFDAKGVDMLMLDLTPDIYEFFNLNLDSNGPTDGQIMMYVKNLDKSTYDYKVTFVYDIYQLDGMTFIVVRAIAPNGYEIVDASAKGKVENFDQFVDLFASVTSDLSNQIKDLK